MKKDNKHLDQIIGQETIKNHIMKVFDIFVRTGGFIKPHFIMTGGSGTANRFGLRMINSLIHKYFIFDGLENAKKEEKRYIDKFVDSSFATNVDIF